MQAHRTKCLYVYILDADARCVLHKYNGLILNRRVCYRKQQCRSKYTLKQKYMKGYKIYTHKLEFTIFQTGRVGRFVKVASNGLKAQRDRDRTEN